MIIPLDLDNFDEQGDIFILGKSLIFFFNESCSLSDKLYPLFEQLTKEKENKDVNFYICDAGKINSRLIGMVPRWKFEVDRSPLLVSYYNGTAYSRYGGDYSRKDLSRFIKEIGFKWMGKKKK